MTHNVKTGTKSRTKKPRHGGEIKKISSAVAKRIEAERERRELNRKVLELEQRLWTALATIKQLVDASNSSAMLLSCVERHLDATVGEDWDLGVRAEVEKRAELMKRRKELTAKAQAGREKLSEVDRIEIAREIWSIARELDIRENDCAVVISLHLQNRDVESALDIVEEVRRDDVALAPEIEQIVRQLVARCSELVRETGDEVATRRVENVVSQITKSRIVTP